MTKMNRFAPFGKNGDGVSGARKRENGAILLARPKRKTNRSLGVRIEMMTFFFLFFNLGFNIALPVWLSKKKKGVCCVFLRAPLMEYKRRIRA